MSYTLFNKWLRIQTPLPTYEEKTEVLKTCVENIDLYIGN